MSQASLVVQQERICQCRRHGFDPWVGKIPWGRICQPIPVFLPGKSHGQRSLVGYSPWCRKWVGPEKQKAEIKQSGTWMRPWLSQGVGTVFKGWPWVWCSGSLPNPVKSLCSRLVHPSTCTLTWASSFQSLLSSPGPRGSPGSQALHCTQKEGRGTGTFLLLHAWLGGGGSGWRAGILDRMQALLGCWCDIFFFFIVPSLRCRMGFSLIAASWGCSVGVVCRL